MHLVIALLFIAICLYLLANAMKNPSSLKTFCAASALFSIGYYGLPMLMLERSTLRYLPEVEVFGVIAMALIFFIALVSGVFVFTNYFRLNYRMRIELVDNMASRYWWVGAVASLSVVLAFNSTRTLTFYQVESVDAFIDGRSSIEGIIGFLSGICQALFSVYAVSAIMERSKLKIAFSAFGLLTQLAMVAGAGQRMILLFPILLTVAAMVAARNFRLAGISLVGAVLFLLIISPFAVAIRSGSWNNTQEVQAESFSYGENPVDTMLQSIVDRGDILQNMATLKAYVDSNGYVNRTYYFSVFVIPVPRFIYQDKPYILSDTGTLDGEASVLAWRLTLGSTIGSLTAFGSIVAYREGGWLWVPVNGFLTGMLISFLLTLFQRGGHISHAFFCLGFVNWSIRKVPPSLMEVLVDVMTYLPVILALWILNRLLKGNAKSDNTGSTKADVAPPVAHA